LDGSSFATAVCGRLDGWKDTAICEYCGEGVIQPMRLIRRGNHKYVYVPGCEPLLFDLRADPLEQHNLAGQQEVRKIEASLREELLADWDGEAAQVATIVRQSQKERRAIAAALRTGHRQAWDWPPGPMFT